MKNGCTIDNYGNCCWYLNDKLHREDGPAFIMNDGTLEWWFEGTRVTVPKCDHKIHSETLCIICLKNFRDSRIIDR
jgi:hypothetical protein